VKLYGCLESNLDLDYILDNQSELIIREYDDITSLIIGFKAITDFKSWRLAWYVKDDLKSIKYLEDDEIEPYTIYVRIQLFKINQVQKRDDFTL
jgi:hypothetical protein